MKEKHWLHKTVICGWVALTGFFTGCTTYVQSPPPPAPVYVAPPPGQPPVEYVPAAPPPVYTPAPAPETVVVIQSVSDFYGPLSPYGRWLDVPGYGRCWTPAGVDRDWRPYTEGRWRRTDAGWYWVSDERWGWATCHYGRWRLDERFGWIWIPQTQWAPAWVAWRDGGGYTGWAPLPPEDEIGPGGILEHRGEDLDQRAFVFVRQDQMLEPHRRQDVIVNNTAIINKTVNITKIQVVNNIVINEGPRPDVVARATGQKIETVPARALRTEQEAHVVGPGGPSAVNHRAATPNSNPPHAPAAPNQGRPPVAHTEVKPAHPSTPQQPSANQPERRAGEAGPAGRPLAPGTAQAGLHSRTNLPAVRQREVNQPEPRPGQPPKVAIPAQSQPQSHPAINRPAEPGHPAVTKPTAQPGHPVKQPSQPAQTPQQKLEQEKQQKAAEQRRLEQEKSHHPASTNSPAPPH